MPRVVDADGHVLEPADLWTSYIEPKYRDICPAILTTDDGSEVIRIDYHLTNDYRKSGSVSTKSAARPFGFGNAGAFGAGRLMSTEELERIDELPYEGGRRGGFDPHARIGDMDAEGIDAAFLYPTIGLFLGAIRDPSLAAAAARAYNRWLADYCAPFPDRLHGVAMIPLQSADAAVSELRYAVEVLGFRAGYVPPTPTVLGALHDPALTPIWETASALEVAIGVHGGSGNLTDQLGATRFTTGRAVHLVSHTLEMFAAATSFIMCGICDRFPDLHVGFLESGGGWMAGLLDRMDRHFDDPAVNDTELSTRPSEIFRRQCFISFEPVEHSLAVLAEYLGPTNILWATDYPHADGFPDAPAMIRKLGLPPAIEEQILGAGAERFYRVPR
jgi:predicted TIM-barrel fold metal-dependent hydrolase